MLSSLSGVTTQCYTTPDDSGSSTPTMSASTALPVVADVDYAKADLDTYLKNVDKGVDPAIFPDKWLQDLEKGEPGNWKWPAVLGAEEDHAATARIYRALRKDLLSKKKELEKDKIELSGDKSFLDFAQILYKHITKEYEYVASLPEFWVLLAVYVVPDWIAGFNYQDTTNDVRFMLKRGLTRDALARHWWKYHALQESLRHAPTTTEHNNASPSVWQERTRVYCYEQVVSQTATAKEISGSRGQTKVKNLGKALCVRDGSADVVSRILKDAAKPSES